MNLDKTQNKKKIKMLKDIKKEIENLENEISFCDYNNRKLKNIRNYKKTLKLARLILPYLIFPSFLFNVLSDLDSTPFIRNDIKIEKHIKTEEDSLGNICYESKYDDYVGCTDTLTYYSKWELYDESKDLYTRSAKVYKVDDIDFDKVQKLLNDDNITLTELLDFADEYKILLGSNLSDEELEKDFIIKLTTYSKDENDYIIKRESFINNMLSSLCFVGGSISVDMLLCMILDKRNTDILISIKTLKNTYPDIDIEDLQRTLEIKKSNYKRLTRE